MNLVKIAACTSLCRAYYDPCDPRFPRYTLARNAEPDFPSLNGSAWKTMSLAQVAELADALG